MRYSNCAVNTRLILCIVVFIIIIYIIVDVREQEKAVEIGNSFGISHQDVMARNLGQDLVVSKTCRDDINSLY